MSEFSLEEIAASLPEGYGIEIFMNKDKIEVWLKTPYNSKTLIDSKSTSVEEQIETITRIAISCEQEERQKDGE